MSGSFDIVIVGAGSGGLAVAASLLKRDSSLNMVVCDAAEFNYYQPAWTLVGAGEYDSAKTKKSMDSIVPGGVVHLKENVASFDPENNKVTLESGTELEYQQLVVAPGLVVDWDAIDGLSDTLGKNGVTSNYSFETAPYTWDLVQQMKEGTALFTQPPMPIKCAGAPQKAMYLSCSEWEKQGVLDKINVEFHNAGGVLFGVADFVPPLMEYVNRYNANLAFNSNLIAVNGDKKEATFKVTEGEESSEKVVSFDMMHVTPPQRAPAFVKDSPLSNDAGWLEVDDNTLQSTKYPNVFGVGDVLSTANTKTMAAARVQAPLVATNVINVRNGVGLANSYQGYGACPLTVEKGKIILAEFGYGGKLLPTLPLDPTVPRRLNWFMKKDIMPSLYWNAMLKGREIFTKG